MQKITTFLMFNGQAEEAMNFYTSLCEDGDIIDITRYGPGEAGHEGTVMHATFSMAGQEFMPLDTYAFSPRFGWCSDRFGVSWQLTLQVVD